MPAATDLAQILVGTGDLYLGYTSTWSPIGGFRDGLMIRFTRDYNHLKGFDQSLGFVRSVLTGVQVEVETNLAQATFLSLRHVMGINSVFTVDAASLTHIGFSFNQSTFALKFIGEDDAGDLKTWIFSQCVPISNPELSYSREGQVLMPLTVTVLSTTVVGTPTANDRATLFGAVYVNSI